LARFTPFFSDEERRQAGCQHRLFFSQVEFCDNLIFYRRTALDKLGERLLDANRTIGQPNKITIIFGRKITRQHRGKLQTEIEDMHLPNPVIRSHYRNGFIKQYVRDHLILRTEAATNNAENPCIVRRHLFRRAAQGRDAGGMTDTALGVTLSSQQDQGSAPSSLPLPPGCHSRG
jgi:hypothetical protein